MDIVLGKKMRLSEKTDFEKNSREGPKTQSFNPHPHFSLCLRDYVANKHFRDRAPF